MFEQRVHCVADQVGRGLIAGHQQQYDEHHHVEFVEDTVLRRIDEHADEIVSRRAAAPTHRLAQVPEKLAEVVQQSAVERVLARRTRRDLDDRIAPAFEVVATLGLDAEHLGDDRHGKRNREILDDVEAFAALELRQTLRYDPAGARFPGLDPLRRECSIHDLAHHVVARWIDAHQIAAPLHRHRVDASLPEEAREPEETARPHWAHVRVHQHGGHRGRREQIDEPQHLHDVVVACDADHLRLGRKVDRRVLAQRAVRRIRIVTEAGREGVVVEGHGVSGIPSADCSINRRR